MKPGIVVIAEITGPVAERIHEIQRQYDPRMAAELPPHLTLVGSSGMGPLSARTDSEQLREALIPAAHGTPPLTLEFEPPMRFMQSKVVVLPLDPNGPVRALHERIVERIRAAKIVNERARFTFTPHCTLNLYRELPPEELRSLLAMRFDEPVRVDAIQAYRATSTSSSKQLFALPLAG
ncbi:MAG: 2'-5' RNA ligase family protein [Gemmatimonadaceae bacterium]